MRVACRACGELNSEFNLRCSGCDGELTSARARSVVSEGGEPADEEERPRDGEVIGGRYRLDRRLGEGGMGVVYAATHLVTGRRWALKFVKGSGLLRPDARRRFLREARIAALLEHPNVIDVSDVFEEAGSLVMVMELLDGETLRERLTRAEKLTVEEACSILLPVASAIGAAHANGIVHRDLKPENIFVTRSGPREARVRVLDFGIAKLFANRAGPSTTESGTVLGTPLYMAPEQCFGERDVDGRADIWSLGAMLYEALSGTRPVSGESAGEVMKALLGGSITPLAERCPELPRELVAMVDRMLSRERAERPDDLRPVAALLAQHTTVRAPDIAAPGPAPLERDSAPSPSLPSRQGRATPSSRDEERPAAFSATGASTPSGSRRSSWGLPLVALVLGALALGVLRAGTTPTSAASSQLASVAPAVSASPPQAPASNVVPEVTASAATSASPPSSAEPPARVRSRLEPTPATTNARPAVTPTTASAATSSPPHTAPAASGSAPVNLGF